MTRHRGRKGGNQAGGISITTSPVPTPPSIPNISSGSSASDTESSEARGGYFERYAGFDADHDMTWIDNFDRLAIHQAWTKKQRKARRIEAVQVDMNFFLGDDVQKKAAWQKMVELCGIDIDPLPDSITKCKKAIAGVHINIYNFLDHCRNPQRFRVRHFASVSELRDYSVPNLIYPIQMAKEDTFLKSLLRPLFFKRSRNV